MCPIQKTSGVAGVDGCRSGWAVVLLDPEGRRPPGFHRLDTLQAVFQLDPAPARVWIDIPIGLPGPGVPYRPVDREARRFLGPGLGSRVFSAPARAAVQPGLSYAEALRKSRESIGVGLSKQAFHIIPKIREADNALDTPEIRDRLLEAHPELVFAVLNGGTALSEPKRTAEGRARRLNVLEQWFSPSARFFERILASTRRSELAADDIIDALALAVGAAMPGRPRPLPEDPDRDGRGRPMQMVLPGGTTPLPTPPDPS